MKKQSLLRVAALLMAMLMILAAFAGCKSKNKKSDDDVDTSSAAVFRNALTGFVTDLGEREEFRPFVKALEGGSMEFLCELDIGEMSLILGGDSNGTVTSGGKIYFGEKEILLKDFFANANSPSEDISFNVKGDFYLSPDYMYASNDNILGGTVGIVRGEMKKAFQNASWKNEIDSEYVDMITKLLEFYDGDGIDEAAEDVKDLAERYVKVLWDALEDNAKYDEETRDVLVGGASVESRVVTMTFDEESVIGFLNDLYNAVKNDGELRDLVIEYGDMLSEYTGVAGSEIGSYYDELLTQLGTELEGLEEDMTPGAIIVEVVTPTGASTLRKLTFSVRNGGEGAEAETYLTLDLGAEGIKTTNRIELAIMDEMSLVYEITQNDSSAYKASMKLTQTYYDWDEKTGDSRPVQETFTAFTVDWNKNSGAFTLDVPELEFTMGGTIKIAGDTTTIVINKIGYENEVINRGFSYTIIVDENDPMPKVLDKNEITNVLTLTVDELEAIVDRAEEIFGNIFGGQKADQALWLPSGYQPYRNDYIYFAYPQDWSFDERNGTVTLLDNKTGNNITVARDARNSAYENFSMSDFDSAFRPELEASGCMVGRVDIYGDSSYNGTPFTVVTYEVLVGDGNLVAVQTMCFVNSGEYTYIVNVTNGTGESDLEYNVLNSITSFQY